MKKIERYILRNILYPFSFCLILISFLYLVIDLSTELEDIIKNKIALTIILEYYFYAFPKIIYEIIPLCLLVAAIYSLTKMNKYNEIIAMRASGISLLTILKPFLTFSLLIVFLMFLNQEKLIPFCYQKLKNIEYLMEGKKHDKLYKDITFYARGNRIIFAKSFYPEANLLDDVIILEQGLDKKVLYKIRAESAQYLKGKWFLYNLIIYKLKERGTEVEETVALSKKEYDLNESPKELINYDTDLSYQSLKTLLKRVLDFREISQEVTRRLSIEIYHKLSFPFTNFVLLLLALHIGLKSKGTSLLKGLGTAVIIGFGYYILDAFSYSLGKVGYLPPFLGAFFANIFFLFLGVYFLIKTLQH